MGSINDKIRMNMPSPNVAIVFALVPFHSFKTMPQMLLQIIFNDINMLQENEIITPFGSKKLLPMPNAKNCEYQRIPAKAQKSRLLVVIAADVLKICIDVPFFLF